MRPRFAEAESRGGFLGGNFGRCFDNGTERITHHAGILPVRMVNAPELVARLKSHGRAHGPRGAQPVFTMVYQLHNMRAQSG